MDQPTRWPGLDPELRTQFGVLWGKSDEKAGGTFNLLLSHLYDTAAVAELMWERFLAPSTRDLLDEIAGGQPGAGKRLFVWLCGIHDCGKATPAFQRLWPKGLVAVSAVAGLSWRDGAIAPRGRGWKHDKAGGFVLRELLAAAGWADENVEWVWPLIAGHHGRFPTIKQLSPSGKTEGHARGKGAWPEVQRALVEVFTRTVTDGELPSLEPAAQPSRAQQLHISGLIVMADWIASDQRHFPGIAGIDSVSFERARARAEKAWTALGLVGGWGRRKVPDGVAAFRDRFGEEPRQSQRMVIEAIERMTAPGLVILEAPMGEGKTKGAMLGAEILAARFGADGVFIGMPTQATSDPMFTQTRSWVGGIDPDLTSRVALLHGKRMFNKEWRALLEGSGTDADARFSVDEYGMTCCDDEFADDAARGPGEWFLGPQRGLLCPFVVGTIDQLLIAATRTKHVQLRMAGLVGKVVILDEVHAADVYMSQFLLEALRWLGQARVPVIMLSATLPPAQRRRLMAAYLDGAGTREPGTTDTEMFPEPQGYPCVTTACPGDDGRDDVRTVSCAPWRRVPLKVRLEALPEVVVEKRSDRAAVESAQADADAALVRTLEERLPDGGCVLVIRNTVDRARTVYDALRTRFGGDDVRLLHGRLTFERRADGTIECLDLLGPPGREAGSDRPARLILVATQLAEQSFDVDVDLLVTDIAAVDMLLQRIGRLHRHGGVVRPETLKVPTVILTGFQAPPQDGSGPPCFLGASEFIYSRYLLLRTFAAVQAAEGATWDVPRQVPDLVAEVFAEGVDAKATPWPAEEEAARTSWAKMEQERVDEASKFLLTKAGEHTAPTLEGLHYAGSADGDDQKLRALVRDGDESIEVVLVVQDERGYATLKGRRLTENGDVADDLLEGVVGATVRLPPMLTKAARSELRPLPGWLGHPWLRGSLALVLDGKRQATIDGIDVGYDDDLGLIVKRRAEQRISRS